jgi:hypothetical protein
MSASASFIKNGAIFPTMLVESAMQPRSAYVLVAHADICSLLQGVGFVCPADVLT